MKILVNKTYGIWAKELNVAVRYIYAEHEFPGKMRVGCNLTFERNGLPAYTIFSFGKYQNIPGDTRYIPDVLEGKISYEDNLAVTCMVDGKPQKFKVEANDKIYLHIPEL